MKILIKTKLSAHKSKTPEGYLICEDAILARTGKQSYMVCEIYPEKADDNSMIDIDRKPKEVFNEKTLASFENKPITIEHPMENVTPDNYKDLAVGFVRDIHKGKYDGQDVMLGNLVITDSEAIRLIEDGILEELSCGYDCDITEGDNPEQINIRGNHIALCECGRAGIARIVDSIDDAQTSEIRNLKKILGTLSKMYTDDPDISYIINVLKQNGYEVDIDSVKGWDPNKHVPGEQIKRYILNIDINGKLHHILVELYADEKDFKVKEINTYMTDSVNDKLIQSSSKEAFDKNVETEVKAGKPRKQALAIAYSIQRKNKKDNMSDALELAAGMTFKDLDNNTWEIIKLEGTNVTFKINNNTTNNVINKDIVIEWIGKVLNPVKTVTDRIRPNMNFAEYVENNLKANYVYESDPFILCLYTTKEDLEKSLNESIFKNLPHRSIEKSEGWYLIFNFEDIFNFYMKNKREELIKTNTKDSLEENFKYVIYYDQEVYKGTNLENYCAQDRDINYIQEFKNLNSIDEVVKYLTTHTKITEDNLLISNDLPKLKKKLNTKDEGFTNRFYKQAIKELKSQLISLENDQAVSDSPDNLAYREQKNNLKNEIKKQISTYEKELADREEKDDIDTIELTPDTKIKEYYLMKYPNDGVGKSLKDNVTFRDLLNAINNYENIFDILGGDADSLVREVCFAALAELTDSSYETIFNKWLKANKAE